MHNLVREIFEKQLHRSCQDIQPFRDGLVSHVHAVTSGNKEYVIRLNQNFADAYRKEEWAMAQAAVVGVPVPALYGIGTHDEFDYMIMERIAGTVVTDYKGDMARLFHEVGRLASLINGIPVEGYGYSVDFGSGASPCFMET